jgi:Fe-S cluster assembly iron-binding protein IscA
MEVIEFTGSAIQALKKYKDELHISNSQFLRIGINQKTETNKRLKIGFDEKSDKDSEVEIEGMKIVYSKEDVFYFAGMRIDFVEQDGRKGFTFVENKKATF